MRKPAACRPDARPSSLAGAVGIGPGGTLAYMRVRDQRRPGGPRPSRISTRPTSWCAAREGVLARLAAGRSGRAIALARGVVVKWLRDGVRRALARHADVPDLLSAGPAIEDGGSDEQAKGVGRRADSERVEAGRRLVGSEGHLPVLRDVADAVVQIHDGRVGVEGPFTADRPVQSAGGAQVPSVRLQRRELRPRLLVGSLSSTWNTRGWQFPLECQPGRSGPI
jgi:hypothetical protein